jgi:hypothetical protein
MKMFPTSLNLMLFETAKMQELGAVHYDQYILEEKMIMRSADIIGHLPF